MGAQVTVNGDELVLPAGVTVTFMRTLRIPEVGLHPLPPGLGRFPLRRVADYPHTTPSEWRERGGVMLPIYQREALWLRFGASDFAALQVGVGKVCAISGEPWSDTLRRKPQNYLALPEQPWLDGINAGDGYIRQFVAVPMGIGATVESQVTGAEVWGGVQLQVFAPTASARERHRAEAERSRWANVGGSPGALGAAPGIPPSAPGGAPPAPGGAPAPGSADGAARAPRARAASMGMGAGGRMRQQVIADRRPQGDYEPTPAGRVFVHLASAEQWLEITGEAPPPSPVTPKSYTDAGLPWFDYYAADAADVSAPDKLAEVQVVGEWLGPDQSPWTPPSATQTVQLGDKPVDDGAW